MPGYLTKRVVQVHPLVLCNLECAHCYSSSGRGLRTALPADRIVAALEVLRGEGYEAVSISGGEPFLYRELDRLVAGARGAGYSVNVITNGTTLTNRRHAALLPELDFVAVSVDGSPANHDRIRRSEGAFERAQRGIDVLGDAGVPFGITFCVTTTTLEDVPWVYELASAKGARLLSLRPLAPVGRAEDMTPEALTAPDQARLFLLAQLLDGDGGPRVRVDLAPVRQLVVHSAEAFPVLAGDGAADHRLSDWVNPLVLDERGRFLPYAYGVHPRFAVAHLDDCDRLREGSATRTGPVVELLGAALGALEDSERALVDWFELVTATSHAAAAVVARA